MQLGYRKPAKEGIKFQRKENNMIKTVNAEKIEPNLALWDLEIKLLEGKSLEKKGREEVNEMLDTTSCKGL